MAQTALERRVVRLEREVSRLTRAVDDSRKKDWRQTIGMFTGDEVMKRIDAAALDYREADRRRSRGAKSRGRGKKS
jgi:hypothetical protein